MESPAGEEFYSDFYSIVTSDIPLVDVRAPVEFKEGAFPNAVNLPLMNNGERHKVGTCYNEGGHEAAVELGQELVAGETKKQRLKAWTDFIKNNPEAMIYCARGGMRSEVAQKWIKEATGELVPRLKGGFKAFRNYLIDQLQPGKQEAEVITLGGYTGSGKTILLDKLKNSIDLEGLANHRGSGFGSYLDPQPPPIDFENKLATALIKHRHQGYKYLVVEDESQHIGKLFIPNLIFDYFIGGAMVVLEVPRDRRVEIIFDEYVVESQEKYIDHFGENAGLETWRESIKGNLNSIKDRLGGSKHRELTAVLAEAFERQINGNGRGQHKEWIRGLLENYYDPMYGYHLDNLSREVIFKGNFQEVLDYFKDLENEKKE